jgi:hypothetical protein
MITREVALEITTPDAIAEPCHENGAIPNMKT